MMKRYVAIWLMILSVMISIVCITPNPVIASDTSSDRTVLAELFTSTDCSYCPYAEDAIDKLADEYGADKLAVLEYHVDGRLVTEDAIERMKYYYGEMGTGTPTMIFDGVIEEKGADPSGYGSDYEDSCYDAYKEDISERREIPSPFEIRLNSEIIYDTGRITTYIKTVDTPDKSSLKIRFVVFEDNVYEPKGEEGGPYYRYVVRKVLDETSLGTMRKGEIKTYTRVFEIEPEWDITELGVVVFIQTDENVGLSGIPPGYHVDDEVLQSAMIKFGLTVKSSDETSINISKGSDAVFHIDVTNLRESDTYTISLIEDLPEGWKSSFCSGGVCYPNPSDVHIGSDKTKSFEVTITASDNASVDDIGRVIFYVSHSTHKEFKGFVLLQTTVIPGPTKSSLNAELKKNGTVLLIWSKNKDDNFERYEIHMSQNEDFVISNDTLIKVITDRTQYSYLITGLTKNEVYYFKIRVYDTNGLYTDSDEVSVKISISGRQPDNLIPGFEIVSVIAILLTTSIIKRLRKR